MTTPTPPPAPGWPAWLRDALDAPAVDRKPWSSGLANAYIALFLLIVYYDQLGRRTLAVGGLGWSIAGAAVAGLLAYALLFAVPALWGLRSRQPLYVVVTRTFGARGSGWIPGLPLAAAQVVWMAALLSIGADLTLGGLATLGLIDPDELARTTRLGSLTLRSPLFLFVTLIWGLAASGLGIWLVRIIAAILHAYAVFPAIVLGAAMLWALSGLGGYRPLAIDPTTAEPVASGGPVALAMMIQLVFGFFTVAGLSAADWGSVSRSARDVRVGGFVGVALAAPILATLPLLAVAGALGRSPSETPLDGILDAQIRLEQALARGDAGPALAEARGAVLADRGANFTLRGVLEHGIGGTAGGIMMLVLALPILGPICYAPYMFSLRLARIRPGTKRWAWSLGAAALAWPLVASGLVRELEPVFGILGALLAPVAGAMAADFAGSRGAWAGPRPGWNLAGGLAWMLGVVVGLLPQIGELVGSEALRHLQPASVLAFVAAFGSYALLARLGLEPASPAAEAAPIPAEAPTD